MTFRKNSVSFIVGLCYFWTMAVLSLAYTLITQEWFMALFPLFFIITAARTPSDYDEFITMDHEGIRCATKKGKVMWAYTWENIIKFKKFSHCRTPAVQIILDDQVDELVPRYLLFFELGRIARKAIRQYYKSKI